MSNPLAELRAIDPQQYLRQIRLDPTGPWLLVSDCTDDAWLYLHDTMSGRPFWRTWVSIPWLEIRVIPNPSASLSSSNYQMEQGQRARKPS